MYFVSTEIDPASDRFVEDNLEELREMFSLEWQEFIFVRGKIGKDGEGRDVHPTIFSYSPAKDTDKGTVSSAYHPYLEKKDSNETRPVQPRKVANSYSLKRSGRSSLNEAKRGGRIWPSATDRASSSPPQKTT